jgi:hypothetical protein
MFPLGWGRLGLSEFSQIFNSLRVMFDNKMKSLLDGPQKSFYSDKNNKLILSCHIFSASFKKSFGATFLEGIFL